jgi:hypothetical protein
MPSAGLSLLLLNLSRDSLLGITLPRLIFAGNQTQVSSHLPTLFEAFRVLQGEHEAQGCKRPYSLHLLQELCLWIALLGKLLQLAAVVVNAGS